MGTDVSPAGVTAYHSPAPVRQEWTHYRWSFGLWSSLPRTKFRLGSNPVRNVRVPDRREGRWIEDDLIKPAALNRGEDAKKKAWEKQRVRAREKRRVHEREGEWEGGFCFFFGGRPWTNLSVCTPCVGIWDTVRIIPAEPKTHQKSQFNFFI